MTHRDGSRESEIIDLYEGWDPEDESISELVERIGISRQRLYQVLDKHDVVPKSKRGKPSAIPVQLADDEMGTVIVYDSGDARKQVNIGWRFSATIVGALETVDGNHWYYAQVDESEMMLLLKGVEHAALIIRPERWSEINSET